MAVFSLRLGIWRENQVSKLLFSIKLLEVPIIKQEKEIKAMQIGKEKVKLFHLHIRTENAKERSFRKKKKKEATRPNKLSKVTKYKANIQKTFVFQYTSKK